MPEELKPYSCYSKPGTIAEEITYRDKRIADLEARLEAAEAELSTKDNAIVDGLMKRKEIELGQQDAINAALESVASWIKGCHDEHPHNDYERGQNFQIDLTLEHIRSRMNSNPLAELRAKLAEKHDLKNTALYHAINEMMAPLGAYGQIYATDDRVIAVMDALHDIDGGVYNETAIQRKLDQVQAKLAEAEKVVAALSKSLNVRAAVEQELWDIYHGKRSLPDKEQCADWSRRLGIPEEYRHGNS